VATGWRRNGSGPRGVFFEDGDVTRPNEAYFAGVDEIVTYAESQDILLRVGLLWLADNGCWSGGTAVPAAQLAQYSRWLGNRYRLISRGFPRPGRKYSVVTFASR